MSVGNDGIQGDGESPSSAISASGRFVAFFSNSANLVPGDTNGVRDVFVRDRALRTTTRVSVDSAGVQGNAESTYSAISANGRFVAFSSRATNLVASDTNGSQDIFLRDTATGITTCVSVGWNGSQADGTSSAPALSADGRFIAFASLATNLVPNDTNAVGDIFVHDRLSGATLRASSDPSGGQFSGLSVLPSISADGSRIAFVTATPVSGGPVSFVGSVYVRDVVTANTIPVSVNTTAALTSGAPSISGNGRFVVFSSGDPALITLTTGTWDVFVHDLVAGSTALVAAGPSGPTVLWGDVASSLSYNGRITAFGSCSTNLVTSDANGSKKDIFVYNRALGSTTIVSLNSLSGQSNGNSSGALISLDGKHVAFYSEGTNLVHGDTNAKIDVFVRDLP